MPVTNNPGASLSRRNADYWVRENKDDTPAGPYTFDVADKQARYLSDLEDRSGLAEMITYVGSRGGDPIKGTPELKVIYMYIRGKRALGGRTAQFHSDRQLPPTT